MATIATDDTLAPELVGVPSPFFILATVTFIARMIIRFRRKKIGLDDAFLAAALVFHYAPWRARLPRRSAVLRDRLLYRLHLRHRQPCHGPARAVRVRGWHVHPRSLQL